MNKEIKRKWLRALRGKSPQGEYLQCQGCLCDDSGPDDSFCCLGVLVNETTGFGEHSRYLVFPESSFLPSDQHHAYGLTEAEQCWLAKLNDNLGMSFGEIADWIEENL